MVVSELLLVNHFLLGISVNTASVETPSAETYVNPPSTEMSRFVRDDDRCSSACASCSPINGCLLCKKAFYLIIQRRGAQQRAHCLDQCPMGFFNMTTTNVGLCVKCSMDGCLDCFNNDICLNCSNNFILHNSHCYLQQANNEDEHNETYTPQPLLSLHNQTYSTTTNILAVTTSTPMSINNSTPLPNPTTNILPNQHKKSQIPFSFVTMYSKDIHVNSDKMSTSLHENITTKTNKSNPYKSSRKKNKKRFVCCCIAKFIKLRINKAKTRHKQSIKRRKRKYDWLSQLRNTFRKKYERKCKTYNELNKSNKTEENQITTRIFNATNAKIADTKITHIDITTKNGRHKMRHQKGSLHSSKKIRHTDGIFRKFERKCNIKWKKGDRFMSSKARKRRKEYLLQFARVMQPDFFEKAR